MSIKQCNGKPCHIWKQCPHQGEPFSNNKICETFEKIVNQDNTFSKGKQFEIPFTEAKVDVQNLSGDDPSAFNGEDIDKWAMIVQLFFFDRIAPREIADTLHCTPQRVYEVIRDCRKSLLNSRKKRGRPRKKN